MGAAKYRSAVVFLLAIVLGACSVVHSPTEFRQITGRKSQSIEVEESFETLHKRLQYQIEKCLAGFYSTNQGYGGDSVRYDYKARYESKSDTNGTFLVSEYLKSSTIGITVGTSDSFAAIADLEGVTAQTTQVTVYARRKKFAKAFRLWVTNESEACPRI